MLKHLEFLNPVKHPAMNVTVRRGVKWAGEYGSVIMCGTGIKPPKYLAQIWRTCVMRCCDIPLDWLDIEHDEECRTHEGLMVAMREAYRSFDSHEIVTVVFFEVGERIDG